MRVIDAIGEAALYEQLAEEAAELAQAASKMARKIRGENPTPKTELTCLSALHEEISDTGNCIDELISAGKLDKALIDDLKKRKMKRWERRINEARKNAGKS